MLCQTEFCLENEKVDLHTKETQRDVREPVSLSPEMVVGSGQGEGTVSISHRLEELR